ncbi:ABC transporter ATP-binding protein [Microvirga guangxiensis]|jgi:branched-chain amino acid transport system ATP-binding protein|uniref:Amino acid/amide ABC transporter ATP-binding protein 2, HAAT family n=1 Tax=Microvirga guangxiensis TaxID=549386 RepID=A0A1G5L1I8_9HYPH|nr:ATP-binding cassette domain-containing protein [Microvirga guangxiensis]SCZ06160.1 amino acid/amide ABC transporter ATP-binding protein 2, HAAT family [Microvirga guangxiensis]
MLKLTNVHASIGNIPILRHITVTVDPAETIALVGRNGAGKTTLLRTIMGFTQSTGEMHFEGRNLRDIVAHKRPELGIGYAPEDRRLFSRFTITENILLPARVAGLDAAETKRRLERIYLVMPELETLGPRPAGSVSGGQGKMVALGRAMMLATKLLLLDEPFQGLAPVLAHRYAEALGKLREIDPTLAIIITESNPHLLKSFAARTITVERGQIDSDLMTERMEA